MHRIKMHWHDCDGLTKIENTVFKCFILTEYVILMNVGWFRYVMFMPIFGLSLTTIDLFGLMIAVRFRY